MANFRPNTNRTPELFPCACTNKEGIVVWQGYTSSQANCSSKCAYEMGDTSGDVRPQPNVGGLNMRKATGTSFKRPSKGGTGQHVAWRNAGGTILGYTPMQVIIAVGVGVGAYFLYKKYK